MRNGRKKIERSINEKPLNLMKKQEEKLKDEIQSFSIEGYAKKEL